MERQKHQQDTVMHMTLFCPSIGSIVMHIYKYHLANVEFVINLHHTHLHKHTHTHSFDHCMRPQRIDEMLIWLSALLFGRTANDSTVPAVKYNRAATLFSCSSSILSRQRKGANLHIAISVERKMKTFTAQQKALSMINGVGEDPACTTSSSQTHCVSLVGANYISFTSFAFWPHYQFIY